MDHAQESAVVVGGGLAGCLVACELRRLGYGEVILFERLDAVCEVGLKVFSEIHAGGEYPFDRRSAVDCLHGLVVFRRSLPGDILTKPPSQLLVSTGGSRQLDGERYAAHLSMLQYEFEKLVRADPAIEADICAAQDFWRRLDPDEYSDVVNVEAGFVTPQRGVQPELLAAAVKRRLVDTGVDVRGGHEVLAVARKGTGSFQVVADSPWGRVVADCSQVVLANHVRGFPLMMQVADEDFTPPVVFGGLRIMALAEHGSDRPFPAPTRFMLDGRFGAMEAPIDRRRSFVYNPPLSHLR